MRKANDMSAASGVDHARSTVDAAVAVRAVSSPEAALSATSGAQHAAAPEAPAPPSSAAHAVATIQATVNAVNAARIAGHSSVEVKLSFADDTQVAVRVELRDGAVHTTFRTDSPELRDALAHEWNVSAPTLTTSAGPHPVRLATPIFARATPQFGSSGSSTGGQSQSRQTPTPEPPAAVPSFATAPRDDATARPTIPATPSPILGTNRLNTFA